MNNNRKTTLSFRELLEKCPRIVIPKIQRDYAQGRKAKSVEEIRTVFVHSLFETLSKPENVLELDFIYGDIKDKGGNYERFEPLDGQQRLTTLFLLHWFLGYFRKDLTSGNVLSVLRYETRSSSEYFCDALVNHDPFQIMGECFASSETNLTEANLAKPSSKASDSRARVPREIILDRGWFQWEWKFDPTVNSMLVMLDAFFDEFLLLYPEASEENFENLLETLASRLDSIRFDHLSLEELKMSDELYIKMNARGKQLSSFDIMKSTLEEVIQKQLQKNPEYSGDIERRWREGVDGAWASLFWQKFGRNKVSNLLEGFDASNYSPTLGEDLNDTVFDVERKMKLFILRLIAFKIIETIDDDNNELKCYAADFSENSLENLLYRCNRSADFELTFADFEDLIATVNGFILENGEEFVDLTSLLDFSANLEPISPQEKSYLDYFTDDDVSHDVKVIFYLIAQYLKAFPDNQPEKHEIWLKNFNAWVKFTRNIYKRANSNKILNNDKDTFGAINEAEEIFARFKSLMPDIYNSEFAVNDTIFELYKKFIQNSDTENSIRLTKTDQRNLDEEFIKSALLHSENSLHEAWREAINITDRHPYIWGQITGLLDWSSDTSADSSSQAVSIDDNPDTVSAAYNLDTFRYYSDKLVCFLGALSHDKNANLFNAAVAIISQERWRKNIPAQENQPGRISDYAQAADPKKNPADKIYKLWIYSTERDNGIKTYLTRPDYYPESPSGLTKGALVRILLDIWQKDYSFCAKPEEFLKRFVNDTQPSEEFGWIYALKCCPDIIALAPFRRISVDLDGFVVLPASKNFAHHSLDPVLLCVMARAKETWSNIRFYDSQSGKPQNWREFAKTIPILRRAEATNRKSAKNFEAHALSFTNSEGVNFKINAMLESEEDKKYIAEHFGTAMYRVACSNPEVFEGSTEKLMTAKELIDFCGELD